MLNIMFLILGLFLGVIRDFLKEKIKVYREDHNFEKRWLE